MTGNPNLGAESTLVASLGSPDPHFGSALLDLGLSASRLLGSDFFQSGTFLRPSSDSWAPRGPRILSQH
jgi:hypothetical protein